MKVSIQYRIYNQINREDPYMHAAWHVVELPMPPRVGEHVTVPDDDRAPNTADLEVKVVAWYFDNDPERDYDVLVITASKPALDVRRLYRQKEQDHVPYRVSVLACPHNVPNFGPSCPICD